MVFFSGETPELASSGEVVSKYGVGILRQQLWESGRENNKQGVCSTVSDTTGASSLLWNPQEVACHPWAGARPVSVPVSAPKFLY